MKITGETISMKIKVFSGTIFLFLVAFFFACSVNLKTSQGTEKVDSNTNKENSNTSSGSSSLTTSTADNLVGTYTVSGRSADGRNYEGEVSIIKRNEVYQMSWKIGVDNYDGVAVQKGNTLAAAYTIGNNGRGCGAVIYKINADSLDGKWGEWGVNNAGTERAIPIGELSGNIGSFDVSGTNPDGSQYKGKLLIKKGGNDTYLFAWAVGKEYIGTGVKMGDFLAAGAGAKQCGFVIYEIKDNTLEGKWGVPGSNKLGTEKAVKK